MTDLEKAKSLLMAESYTCVICKEELTFTSQFRGVGPLVAWYEEGMDFAGFSAADKVIGKATAFLYVLLGVKTVYAGVISRSALEVFSGNGIAAQYGILAENIVNRKGDGICPFEEAVLAISNAEDAYPAICRKMKEMNITVG